MRVCCITGAQQAFIQQVMRATALPLWRVGQLCGVSRATLRAWKQEKTCATLEGLTALIRLTGVALPAFTEVFTEAEIRSRRSRAGFVTKAQRGTPLATLAGQRKGGTVSQQRRKAHPEAYPHVPHPHSISTPSLSAELAEFVGIMLGDGSLSATRIKERTIVSGDT